MVALWLLRKWISRSLHLENGHPLNTLADVSRGKCSTTRALTESVTSDATAVCWRGKTSNPRCSLSRVFSISLNLSGLRLCATTACTHFGPKVFITTVTICQDVRTFSQLDITSSFHKRCLPWALLLFRCQLQQELSMCFSRHVLHHTIALGCSLISVIEAKICQSAKAATYNAKAISPTYTPSWHMPQLQSQP